mgnify:CR=1 FL=1
MSAAIAASCWHSSRTKFHWGGQELRGRGMTTAGQLFAFFVLFFEKKVDGRRNSGARLSMEV